MIAKSGIRACMLAKKGTLSGTPLKVFYVGDKLSGGYLQISDADTIEDYLKRPLRNKIGFKSEQKSLQVRIKELDTLVSYVKDRGADMQIVTSIERGLTTSQYEGIFNLFGDNAPGVDFEFVRSPKENSCNIITELNYDYETGKALVSAAQTNVINTDLAATRGRSGLDLKKAPKPAISIIGDPDNNPIYESKEEVLDYKLTVKTAGSKSTYGRTIADYLEIEFMFQLMGPNVAKIAEILNSDMDKAYLFSSPLWAYNASNVWSLGYEAFYFYSHCSTSETKIEDDKRTLNVTMKTQVPLTDVVFDYADGERVQVVKFFEN